MSKIKAYGVGFIGIGEFCYSSNTKLHTKWIGILQRCYNEEGQDYKRWYKGCTVDERWHNFQNFCHDCLLMPGNNLDWNLDKDIHSKGNKIYSRDTCFFLPQEINKLFTKRKQDRGDLPIGVMRSGGVKNPFKVYCGINKNSTYLGRFKTPELAFQVYKQAKEAEIKRVADLFKSQLDPRAYMALINYRVEITD